VTSPTGFLGLSHLGLVSSIGWASSIGPVTVVDSDPALVTQLGAGRLPIHEPGLDELFLKARSRMTFSADPAALSACPLVIVTRDVPTDARNVSDLSAVSTLLDAAIPFLRDGVTLAVMSQIPPGFMRALGKQIETRRPDLDVGLYYWVETLIFGRAVERYLRPERIILGCEEPDSALPADLDAALRHFACPVLRMRYESAEMAKMAINLYLCAGVTYANTMADLCEAVGADWTEMVPALRLDQRIGPAAYIRPSLGIAGGNLERDMITLRGLGQGRGLGVDFIDAMIAASERRAQWVERKLAEHVFREVDWPTVAVWGLAYKRNTRSTKNSVALKILRDLLGRCEVRAWDPMVTAGDIDLPVKIVGDRDEALAGADCVVVLTDWEEFAAPQATALAAMRRRVIIDGVGIVDPSRVDLRGTRVVVMGRG
jgi:UDPglucose 6-dehydrogenase